METQQISELVKKFGEYKKIVHAGTGIAYRVPTRDILVKGIKAWELHKYPLWKPGTK